MNDRSRYEEVLFGTLAVVTFLGLMISIFAIVPAWFATGKLFNFYMALPILITVLATVSLFLLDHRANRK